MYGSFLTGAPRCVELGAKTDRLRRFPHTSSLRRTPKYASVLGMSGALHPAAFEQPGLRPRRASESRLGKQRRELCRSEGCHVDDIFRVVVLFLSEPSH
jgi:hypothetical protein